MAGADPSDGRVAQTAARTVLAASAVLATVELARIGLYGPEGSLPIAIAATVVFLPLHVWHLRFGLSGERPPRPGVTLAVMACAHVAALLLIGPAWSFMLAALATSALIVLPLSWAAAVLAACTLAPLAAQAITPSSDPASSAGADYLMVSVVFRAVLQFAIVWVVATAHQLAIARAALAAAAVEQERVRLQAQVRASLERRMTALETRVGEARAALAESGVAAPLLALDGVVATAREALVDLRHVVVGARGPKPHVAADALAQAARSARAPVRTITRFAWLPALATHIAVLGYMFVFALELPSIADEPDAGLLITLTGWAAIAGLFGWVSCTVARGRRPRRSAVAISALLGVGVGLQFVSPWFIFAVWLPPAAALMLLSGRRLTAFLASYLVVIVAYDTVLTLAARPDVPFGELLWTESYMLAILALTSVGLYASVRMIAVLAELEVSRDALAEQATCAERRRFSADLHDLLGQSLTAIALKGDLARRLTAAGDRVGAERELSQLVALTASQEDEVAAVTRDDRAVAFSVEAENAIDLLRAAGVTVVSDLDLDLDTLEPDVSAVLGWAVREGTTNVLRHATATHCAIVAWRQHGAIVLELTNDGARGGSLPGTGLAALAERLTRFDGSVEVFVLDRARFRIQVTVPERVPA